MISRCFILLLIFFGRFGRQDANLSLKVKSMESSSLLGETRRCMTVTMNNWLSKYRDCSFRWQPPPDLWHKINVDAAVRHDGSATAMVVRDSDGKRLLSISVYM